MQMEAQSKPQHGITHCNISAWYKILQTRIIPLLLYQPVLGKRIMILYIPVLEVFH
ncbi:hypothetical protein XENTR_v10022327 [Xenopus tropicalis]|nr:hypothetical protein XENTR_v10022327 [Xenopus tropicalis]